MAAMAEIGEDLLGVERTVLSSFQCNSFRIQSSLEIVRFVQSFDPSHFLNCMLGIKTKCNIEVGCLALINVVVIILINDVKEAASIPEAFLRIFNLTHWSSSLKTLRKSLNHLCLIELVKIAVFDPRKVFIFRHQVHLLEILEEVLCGDNGRRHRGDEK